MKTLLTTILSFIIVFQALAQDVEKVMPCAVTERELPLHKNDGKSYKTLNYDNLHALLIESIKELTAKVEKLEKK